MVLIMNIKGMLAVGAALSLAACGAPASEPDPKNIDVVTAFYPLEWATSEVLGAAGTVTTLTEPGVEAHDLELTPRQIASLADADLVVYLSDFQPAVDDAIEQSGATNVLDVADYVDLVSAEEHEHVEGEDHDHDAEEADHDHGDFDPHFWQDPQRMSKVVDAIADELTKLTDATGVATNQKATNQILANLDQEFADGLATCTTREFITTHTAFAYLADRYDLTEIGISGINPDAEPSPARIAQVQAEATEHGVTTIFFETLTSDAVATSIAGDLGLKTAVLDPLEGVTKNSPGDDYPSIMKANLEALRSANGCQ